MPLSQTPVVSQTLATSVFETAAFRLCEAVSFPIFQWLYNYHNYNYFGAQYTAYSLAPPLLRTPRYLGRTWASLLTCWLNFGLGGLGWIHSPAPPG